ncbi:MAG: hypothetical protein EA368_13360 [Leptolyngbya sp. DLM2.Bin27]|nr:MAG: hypothetical protein EA368_13360 [Leptolyngbya sp. DLM2.Bin27]
MIRLAQARWLSGQATSRGRMGIVAGMLRLLSQEAAILPPRVLPICGEWSGGDRGLRLVDVKLMI